MKTALTLLTSNNQRLGSAFDDLDPRLSLLCQVGDDVMNPPLQNIRGIPDMHPKINSFTFVDCPIRSRLQMQLAVHFFYVKMQ